MRGRATSARRLAVLLAAAAIASAAGCAHAPPVSGNRDPNAPIDPDYPEQNCSVNNTTDCRPPAD